MHGAYIMLHRKSLGDGSVDRKGGSFVKCSNSVKLGPTNSSQRNIFILENNSPEQIKMLEIQANMALILSQPTFPLVYGFENIIMN